MNDVEVREVEATKTKRKFKVFLGRKNTGFVAKEILQDGSIKWFPFYKSGLQILPRYKNIQFVTTTNKKHPKAGFSMNDSRGYGFTSAQGVSKFVKYIDKNTPGIKGITFVDGTTRFKANGILELGYEDYGKIRNRAKQFSTAKSSEENTLISNTLNEILPKSYKAAGKYMYTGGTFARFASKYSEDNFNLSEEDIEKMQAILLGSGLSTETVIATKKQIDKVYIEDVLSEFKALYGLKSDAKNLEEKWHQFFKKHSWIFSQIFAYPVIFLDDKFNVGGHNITGGTDKIVDFIYQNKLTSNVTFIEIKTHKTKLINDVAYRKPDIYSISKDVGGSVVQVLDQRNQFLKQYHSLKGESSINSLNSGCLVIVGDLASLTLKQKKDSFELYRSANKEVTIITFDEVLEKITTLLSVFTKGSKT